jgi:hypothetical protein
VQKVAADLPEHHANTHDCQCAKGAQLTGKPTKVRLWKRKELVANREAAHSANQPTNDLKDWKGTYHPDLYLSFALCNMNRPPTSQMGSKADIGRINIVFALAQLMAHAAQRQSALDRCARLMFFGAPPRVYWCRRAIGRATRLCLFENSWRARKSIFLKD